MKTWCRRCGGPRVGEACGNCDTLEARRAALRGADETRSAEGARWMREQLGDPISDGSFEALARHLLPERHGLRRRLSFRREARQFAIDVELDGAVERTLEVPERVATALWMRLLVLASAPAGRRGRGRARSSTPPTEFDVQRGPVGYVVVRRA